MAAHRSGSAPSAPAHAPPRVKFEAGAIYPLIEGRLYFTAHRDEEETLHEIQTHKRRFYFSTQCHEMYQPICADFGPVSLPAVQWFCQAVHEKMSHPQLQSRPLIYYCEECPEFLSNMAFLMGAYLVLVHKWSPEEAAARFTGFTAASSPFLPFRDASYVAPSYTLQVVDCLKGLQKAQQAGWFNLETFDAADYELLDDPEEADCHVVADKFLAFRGPMDDPKDEYALPASHYVPIFQERGVEAVIRLNEASTYDASAFTEAGIKHYDLFFEDCTNPPTEIIGEFLRICKEHGGRIAVHCYAGLGRTGTLIAIWLMYNYRLTASEAIAYIRLCRPGSVIGQQQNFLQRIYENTCANEERALNGSSAIPTILEEEEEDEEVVRKWCNAHSKLGMIAISAADDEYLTWIKCLAPVLNNSHTPKRSHPHQSVRRPH